LCFKKLSFKIVFQKLSFKNGLFEIVFSRTVWGVVADRNETSDLAAFGKIETLSRGFDEGLFVQPRWLKVAPVVLPANPMESRQNRTTGTIWYGRPCA